MDIKLEIMQKIKNRELKYQDIPKELKNDKEIALLALEVYDGRICKYLGSKLKDNKEFAKEVFRKKYGYSLSYFSDNVKNDFECCRASIIDGFSGYRYIGDKMKENKELALMEINRKYGHDIRTISKKLRKDKDIIKAHWNKVYKDPSYFTGFCSIIAVDDFGNDIIDTFKKEELKRHTQSRIDEYEEETEPVQFIKYENGKLDKMIFEHILYPFIIIIGEQKNQISNEIIEKYYDNDDRYINIIEIYTKDVETKNIKLITSNEKDIINLLRVITYTTAEDTWLTEDNLNDIREVLWKHKLENKNIEVRSCSNINKLKESDNNFFKGENYVVQIASNINHSLAEYNELMEKIDNSFTIKQYITYHLHDSCINKEFEIYILKLY